METDNVDISLLSVTKKSSSWPIASGSLDDAVTCESSFSALNSVSDSDDMVRPNRKPPLILRRPSPDSGPCEITIFFTQQHEIRQVYVRSTARVYEIYYAANEKGDNEYLCTVRCGFAARIEETDGVGLSTSSSNSNESSCEGHFRSDSRGSTNEDGWVDVKVRNPSNLDARDSCLVKQAESCMDRGNQDGFEATAEISDVDPVLSITLRLLSIQSGEYIYIDEIYVFADPVVSADVNPSLNKQETSSESATMSLLIPTLLQLSKFNRSQEPSDSSAGVRKQQDTEHKSIGVPIISSTSQSESIQGTMSNGASAPMAQSGFPVQRLDSQNNPYPSSERNNFSCSRIEKTLDELVSRVTKIEHFCLRFEETMLKPICNMEVRLERIEQQLDTFVKTAKVSMTACTRIAAPECSFTESDSDSDSIFTGGYNSPVAIRSESVKKVEDSVQDMSITPLDAYSHPNDVPSSTAASQLPPSLVFTAPDFSSIDDEGENGPIEALKDSPKGSPKKPLSIDDCLASALADFLSSASVDTDMFEETADISIKEESGMTFPSQLIKADDLAVPSVHKDGTDISGKDIVEIEQEFFVADNCCAEATVSVDEHSLIYEGDNEKPLGICNEVNLDQVETDLSVDVRCEADDDSNQSYVFGSPDSPGNDTSTSALEIPVDRIGSSSGEETAKECLDTLQNILKLQNPSTVDFGIPLLDVKFLSQESSSKSSLDALMMDVPDFPSEVHCVEKDNATVFNEQCDLVIIDKANSTTSETPNSLLFCLDNYDSGCMPLNREEAGQQECSSNIQDMGASLI